ncbi:hypothetical protein [Streptomyces sp. NPDC059850]|uniref:terpene synthase family protein n=1 Tax=Streptomyces sp. NPDC059850 TaxID=3346970 RepID=UPI003651354C
MPEVRIHPVELPFPPPSHNPLQDRILPPTLEWGRRVALIGSTAAENRLRRGGYAAMIALWAPTIVDLPRLSLLTDWTLWYGVLDDQIDEASAGLHPDRLAELFQTLRRITHHDNPEPAPAGPTTTALADLWHRTTPGTPFFWQQRLREDLSSILTGSLRAATHRATQAPMDIATCVQVGNATRGMRLLHDLQHRIHNLYLPDIVHATTPYQTMLTAVENYTSINNDLVSYEREAAFGELQNLAIILQRTHRWTPQQAIDHLTEQSGQQIQDYLAAERALISLTRALRLPADVIDSTEQAIHLMRALLHGGHAWHWGSDRYQHGTDITANLHSLEDSFCLGLPGTPSPAPRPQPQRTGEIRDSRD